MRRCLGFYPSAGNQVAPDIGSVFLYGFNAPLDKLVKSSLSKGEVVLSSNLRRGTNPVSIERDLCGLLGLIKSGAVTR